MALLGESHHPCPLLLCLRHRVSSGLAQPVKRLVWRKTGEHQKACGHENSSAESLTTMQSDMLSCGKMDVYLFQEGERTGRKWRNTAIRDREGKVADSLIAAERSFLCKVELAHFSGSQQRNQDVNTSLTWVLVVSSYSLGQLNELTGIDPLSSLGALNMSISC